MDRQERVREALLLDLGAVVFELHRQRRAEPELLRSKMAELSAVDAELFELSDALGRGHELPELTARGLVATCTSCAGIMGVRDRHCPTCGAAAGMVSASKGAGPLGETVDLPALDPAELDAALPEGEEPMASRQAPAASRRSPGHESVLFDEGDGEELDDELDDFAAAEEFADEPVDDDDGHGFLEELRRASGGAGVVVERTDTRPTAPASPPRPPEALVPRAQRTLRAGRRRARAWLAERRPEGS